MDLHIKDIGPVDEFEYSIDRPGIHELRGAQGVGKTTILRTIQRLVDKDKSADISKRDGTKKGEASIGDTRTIKVGRVVREEMDEDDILGVGDMNLAELHTPRFKDAVARDRSRIANLIHLSDAPVDFDAFRELLGSEEEFDSVVGSDAQKAGGLLEVAGKVKRAIEAKARDVEKNRKTAEDNLKSLRDSIEGIDLDAESDNDKLMEAFQKATEHAKGLRSERTRILTSQKEIEDTKAKLSGLVKPDVDGLDAKLQEICKRVDGIGSEISELEAKLKDLQEQKRKADSELEIAQNTYDSAIREAKAIEAMQEVVDRAVGEVAPTEEEISKADQAAELAKKAQTNGLLVAQAKDKSAKADIVQAEAKELKRKEQELRDKAKEVFDIIAQAVEGIENCPLRVKEDDNGDLRVVLNTDRSEQELFEDLSDGERWEVIIPLCAGENRIVVIPQAAYGELQPATRKKLHKLAKESGAYILTAVADDCELSARYFED